jgi:excisionase family DNA binding protein
MNNPFIEIQNQLNRIEFLLEFLQTRQETGKPMGVLEASDFLKLAPQTIYGLVFNRKIPHTKKGKKLLFDRSELEAWLQSGKREVANQ